MTATDELRSLLDERGVDYRVSATGYSIDIGPYTTAYANRSDTTLDVSLRQVTPEQTIAAVLGTGTCKADETDLIPFVRANGDVSEVDYIRVMECSSCGGTFEHINGSYEFCPRCGRRIEVDV